VYAYKLPFLDLKGTHAEKDIVFHKDLISKLVSPQDGGRICLFVTLKVMYSYVVIEHKVSVSESGFLG